MNISRRTALALPALVAGLAAHAQAPRIGTAERPLRIGVTSGPHAELLENVRDRALQKGLVIRVIEFQDFIQPNQALDAGELDANAYQHLPFLQRQIADRGYDLVPIGKTVILPMGVYSKRIKSLAELPEGGRVAIPNDPTNGGRALVLLARAGAFGLRPGADHRATVLDIVDNPKRLRIVELEAALLPRSLDDTDASAINTSYAIKAGLNPIRDSIAHEDSNSPYANLIVARRVDANAPWVRPLLEVYHADESRRFLSETFGETVVPAF